MEASARRRKSFEAVRALSLRGARRRPLVLVFEDLHWIDAGTEEYLASMADAVASVPLMLILTYRVGYSPPIPARSFHTVLALHPLSESDAVSMASHVLGAADLPPALRRALLEKAEGVPLFIEEVIKTLLDLGLLEGVGALNVPDTIQGIIMARLDRLGEDGKRTVQLASVIGDLADGPPGPLPHRPELSGPRRLGRQGPRAVRGSPDAAGRPVHQPRDRDPARQ